MSLPIRFMCSNDQKTKITGLLASLFIRN